MESNARITALWTSPRSGNAMVSHDEVTAVANVGLMHCAHARPKGKRQILLVESEILEQFGLQPGQIKENVTTSGIRLQELPAGTHLRLGNAVIVEITADCEPCRQMDAIRPGLKKALEGKRGMLAKVRVGGLLRVGDGIVRVIETIT